MDNLEHDEATSSGQPFWMKHLGKICIGLFLVLSLTVSVINAIIDNREKAEILEQLKNGDTVVSAPTSSPSSEAIPTTPTPTTPSPRPTESETSTEEPSETPTETNHGDAIFTDTTVMMKWVDDNTTPCENWDISEEETLSVGVCDEDSPEEVTVAYDTSLTGIEEIVNRLNFSTSEYHDMWYINGNHWLIISPSSDLMTKASVVAGTPIQMFGQE